MSEETSTSNSQLASRLNPVNMPVRYWLGTIGLLIAAVLPMFLSATWALTFASAYFFGIYAMSWDVVSGYTGQISFGHGLFFAVGGYTSALLNLGYGIQPLLSIPVGVLLAAVAGVLIGVPALRLRGPYLSLVTLVAPLMLTSFFVWQSGIFGGELGLSSPDTLFGLSTLFDTTLIYYIAFGLFVFVLALLLLLTRTDAGAVLTAIREDEDAVAAAGLNAAKFKIMAFILSAAVGGLAGAVIVHTGRAGVNPTDLMSIVINVEVIIAAILGGMGTITGAALGGIMLILLREQLNNMGSSITELVGVQTDIPVLGDPISDISFLIFAVITLFLLFALPGGVIRWAVGIGGMIKERILGESEPEVAADGGRKTPARQVYENYTEQLKEITGGDDDER
jgi:branched-chain amino acid transport system permease protein